MTLRAVQVLLRLDAERRAGDALLRARPTLPNVAAAASRAGVNVAVVQAAHDDGCLTRGGADYHFVAGGARRVIDRVRALAPDVVHLHGLEQPRATRRLARAVRAPVLVQDHGSLAPLGWRRVTWRWAYEPVAAVAFTARAQAEPFAGALPAALPVHEVLESSTAFAPGDRDAARAVTGMHGDPCLLWAGRLDENKDPLTVLAAVERAARRLPGVRLWCCWGRAPLLDAVRRRVATSPTLRARVVLLGTRPHAEMEPRLRAADFFVQASHREGSGYALLEAMACGATPLVTDIPAARRIVGDAGSLTPTGDAGALAEALVAWAARDRDALRAAARARFDAALTFDAVGRELRAAYEAVAR